MCQEKGCSSFQLHEPIFCFFLALVSPDLGKVIFRSSRPGLTWLTYRVRVERSNFQTPFTSQPQEAWVARQSLALSLKVPSYLLPVSHGPKAIGQLRRQQQRPYVHPLQGKPPSQVQNSEPTPLLCLLNRDSKGSFPAPTTVKRYGHSILGEAHDTQDCEQFLAHMLPWRFSPPLTKQTRKAIREGLTGMQQAFNKYLLNSGHNEGLMN